MRERILEDPTVLEIGSLRTTNFGAGLRVNLAPWSDLMPAGYGFIEWSHRYTTLPTFDGDRLFAGLLLQY